MPLYEYECPLGHRRTLLRNYEDYRKAVSCSCGAKAVWVPSSFGIGTPFSQQLMKKGVTMKDVWGDSPLGELPDGENPLRYKRQKPFMDMGKSNG